MDAMQVNDKFFSNLGDSIMDIDGGNIKSKLWFCGIEPGGDFDLVKYQDKENKPHYINGDYKPNFKVPVYDDVYFEGPVSNAKFDNKILQIVKSWAGNQSYVDGYKQNSPIFKLNLFPLPAHSVDFWSKEHTDLTGCVLKSEYYGKCIKPRFQLIREITEKFQPTVIVCIGRQFIKEFKFAFGGREEYNYGNNSDEVILRNEGKAKIHIHRLAVTTIVEIPFFGPHLNSKDDIVAIGKYIAANLLKFPENPV